ncbi:MAG: AAA family ATPase [Bacteroidota bacterium]
MLTSLVIRNFKRFESLDIELGKTVMLVGPNNSGKTTALQALALWDIGVRLWNEKRQGKSSPEKRPGVTINRNDLISLPVPTANLLWKNLHVRDADRIDGKQQTKNVRIDVTVSGLTEGKEWTSGLEFDYANEESFYCRPLRLSEDKDAQRMPIPPEVKGIRIGFLPPMSGLAAVEPKWEAGRISVLLGEGQTAQVLRNLCYQIFQEQSGKDDWIGLTGHMRQLFGVKILPPRYIKERGEITMAYEESNGIQLDISSSGRGLQQTLLLLAHLYANPKTILLLDEPDAHLEVLRQRQIYQLLTQIAETKGSQIIAASHSEIIMNEAADRDMVIAFVGRPHRIDDRGQQVMKALKSIGFDQYYQAEQRGWVLYLEGSTDLAILQALANKLQHKAMEYLNHAPFVHYVGNQPSKARDHFYGLREAKDDLLGVAIFDNINVKFPEGDASLNMLMWEKKEIENYLCREDVLLAFARGGQADDLFSLADAHRREQAMHETIDEISSALRTLKKTNPWSSDIKATDDFLDPLFEKYFEKIGVINILRKNDYHELTKYLEVRDIDPEVTRKLDEIVKIALAAKPTVD